jgi:hypothetical protein
MTRTGVQQTHPPADGWRDWCSVWRHHSPYRHHLVEAGRWEWQAVEVLASPIWDPGSMSPACTGVRCSRQALSQRSRDVGRRIPRRSSTSGLANLEPPEFGGQ